MRKKEKMQIKTNRLQKIFFVYLSFIIILSIFAIIYAILIYSGKMNSETKSFHIVTFFMGILSFLILGIIASSVAKRNGLIEGLIASLIIIIIVFLIHLIWKIEIDAKLFIKGTIYILSSCIGGIIGINLIPKNK